MIIITKVGDKYYYGNKVVCQITEDQYNYFKDIREEITRLPDYKIITFGTDYVFEDDTLVNELEEQLREVKKELQATTPKLKMTINEDI